MSWPLRACPVTGVMVPECSCRQCLRSQIEEHMPGALEPAAETVSRPDEALRRRSERPRRAA